MYFVAGKVFSSDYFKSQQRQQRHQNNNKDTTITRMIQHYFT